MTGKEYWFVHMYPPRTMRLKIVPKGLKGGFFLFFFILGLVALIMAAAGAMIQGNHGAGIALAGAGAVFLIACLWLVWKKTDPDTSNSVYVERSTDAEN